jgi:cell division protein FtsB
MYRRWSSHIFWAAVGSLAIAIVADPRGLRRCLRLKQDAAQMAAGNGRLVTENQKLTHEVHALSSNPRYIQRAAREELGLVRQGEVVLELDSDSTAVAWPDLRAARQP